ncbi:MAG TPA: hypothetical protein VNE41_01270 [Chitinophagaceae bacterium]|nr:hypothetical protein [Chitinophagaceae bacterium]
MKIFFFLGVLISLSWTIYGQIKGNEYGEPLVVLQETRPMVNQANVDDPLFVIYSTGQVIYQHTSDQNPVFYQEKLSKAQTQQLIFDLDLTDTLMTMPDQIMADTARGEPIFQLILNFDTVKSIEVYGNLRDSSAKSRSKVPQVLLSALDHIFRYGNEKDTVWIPDQFEVILTLDDDAEWAPVGWPGTWPQLNDPAVIKRSPDLYSIFMNRQLYKSFLIYLHQLKPGQDTELDGKRFSVSWRFPFPHLR